MDLKKGKFTLELNHIYGCDSIGPKGAKIDLSEGIATFQCDLEPVDDNQKMDADEHKEKGFKRVEFFSFIDTHIRKGFWQFAKNHKDEIECWKVVLNYEGKYSFSCEPQSTDPDGIMFHV